MSARMESRTGYKFTLNNGIEMPAVGFGTYRIRDSNVLYSSVDEALKVGYRLFDTAAVYNNEALLKHAFKTLLPKYGLEREDIFITSKLAPSCLGGGVVTEKAYTQSLENLGVEYLDLYLIHFPGAPKMHTRDSRLAEMRAKTWEKLTEIYDNGDVKAIGVSNFTIKHLEEIIGHSHGVVPVVNQVEWHPYFHQPDLLRYCYEHDIVLQAYCSFGGTSAKDATLLEDPVVTKIAKQLKVSPPQVLLAWALQQNVAVIPKSTNPDHIKSNYNLDFVIRDTLMEQLNQLRAVKHKYAWNPENVA